MTKKIEIIIASLPDRENLVAELWYNNKQLAEIFQEQDNFMLELYPNPTQNYWVFRLDEVLEALEQARRKLINSTDCDKLPNQDD